MSKRKCTMARHCESLSEQGVWAEIERKVNAAHYRRHNKSKPVEEHEYPVLTAARETLADGCNCSLPTIDRYVDRFVDRGMLIPRGEQYRRSDGTFTTNTFMVMLHDDYAKDHPCPPFIDEKVKESRPFPGKGKTKYGEDVVKGIIQLRKEGCNVREISGYLGIPKTTVGRLLKTHTCESVTGSSDQYDRACDFVP